LNAARLYTTGLVEREEAGNSNSIARNIDASLESVEEILGTLLDISRLDTGALKPEFTVFELDLLLNQMAIEFRPMAQEKGIKLRVITSSVAVRSDRRMLSRILQNFISNAIKYSSKGHILVGCRRKNKNIRIEVHDTGRGIPASKQKLIFKEFHRIEPTSSDVKGLGLGLSIVERMGRVLGHAISVKSTPQKGSVFSVEVPTSRALPVRRSTQKASAVPIQQLDDMLVLCIDNEETILNGMEILLTGWGCSVMKASDLRSALAAIKQQHRTPDILLVDYHLNQSNGLDTVTGLRWKIGQDLPAILITADRTPGLRREAGEKFIPILHKPVKPAALRALIARHRVQRIAAE
ncbi:MAG: hybrid sensor histidine kinase/response regulator, partial [Fimbriimonadaceae bacterium]|nr:hybrid sensor histidine kinase/response regulator [Alphaproteobacteria bacterium]